MDLNEVFITSDSVSKLHNCCVYDLKTGGLISSYKDFNTAPKCLALVGEDYIIGGILGQPLIKTWTISKKMNENEKMVVRSEVSALAVSNCGQYCIGAIKKYIYLWEVKSGLLLAIISGHFQNVSCVKFSSDGSHFISGGMDSLVMVWLFSEEIKPESERNPYFVWKHHSQPVTDIHVGTLGVYSRVATTSLDMTCRIYELDTGKLLVSVCMDVPLTSVVMDPAEYFLIVGAENGNIYRINMFSCDKQELHQVALTSNFVFKGHTKKINCLSASAFGTTLLSGSDDKTCKMWDISTLTCLKTIPHDGPVTNAFITVKPRPLSDEKIMPSMTITKFERLLQQRDEDTTQTSVQIASKEVSLMKADRIDDRYNPILLRGSYEHLVPDSEDLKVAVKELKTINNQLYAHSLNSVVDALEDHEDEL